MEGDPGELITPNTWIETTLDGRPRPPPGLLHPGRAQPRGEIAEDVQHLQGGREQPGRFGTWIGHVPWRERKGMAFLEDRGEQNF